MNIIYSATEVKNLEGCYIDPLRFDSIIKSAKLVYTDDSNISKAYKDAKIEVKAITVKKTQPRKTIEK